MNNTLVLLKTHWWSASVSCKQFSSTSQGSSGTLRPFSLSEQHCAQMTTMLTATICQPAQCWRCQWPIRVTGQTENNKQAFIHLLKQNSWERKDLKMPTLKCFTFPQSDTVWGLGDIQCKQGWPSSCWQTPPMDVGCPFLSMDVGCWGQGEREGQEWKY